MYNFPRGTGNTDGFYPPEPYPSFPPHPHFHEGFAGRTNVFDQSLHGFHPARFPNQSQRIPMQAFGFPEGFRPRGVFPPPPENLLGPRKRPAPPPPPKQGPLKKSPILLCELCQVSCYGPKALDDHIRGQRHQRRLKKGRNQISIPETSPAPPPPSTQSKAPTPKQEPQTHETLIHCSICNVVANSQSSFEAHLIGKAHQRTLRLYKELGKPIPSSLDVTKSDLPICSPPEPAICSPDQPIASKQSEGSAAVESQSPVEPVATPLPEGAVGTEYIETISGPGKKATYYRCKLCNCQFINRDGRNLHLTGRRHKLQYKQKVDPSYQIDSNLKDASRDRLSEIPPMPDPRNLPWAAFLSPPNDGVTSGKSAQTHDQRARVLEPSLAWGNRLLNLKHAQIIPTKIDSLAIKTVVSIAEHALKEISDAMLAGHYDLSPVEEEFDSSQEEVNEEDRILCGVVRVGSFGKSLLLRGEYEMRLVLVCALWPTTALVEFLQGELGKQLIKIDKDFKYEVISNPSIGNLTIVASKLTPGEEGWPELKVHIQLTSPIVFDSLTGSENSVASGAVSSDGQPGGADPLATAPEQPRSRDHGRHLFAHGHDRIPVNQCVDALDAIDQAKWFQTAICKPPLGMVSRILLDFMRANEEWLELDEFALLALLDRLLTFDVQNAPRPSRLSTVPYPVSPFMLLRRFFEAISSGLLLQLQSEKGPDGDGAKFFGFTMLAESPRHIREAVTLSAQKCLRQLAFDQLDQILRIENTPVPEDGVHESGNASSECQTEQLPVSAQDSPRQD